MHPGELRDQEILRDIENWHVRANDDLTTKLAAASDENETYARVWEHFSDRHTVQQLARVIQEVATHLLERDGSGAAADHPALIAAWRRGSRRFSEDEYTDWLRELILNAIPASLGFANGLLYYWTGDHGIVSGDISTAIREIIEERLRATIRDGDALAHVLTSRYPYQIGRFITATGRHSDVGVFARWQEFFAPVLLDGAQRHPELVLPEIANLAGDSESNLIAARDEGPPIFVNRYKMDREITEALFGDTLHQVLVLLAGYTGDNPWAARATREAAAWLQERQRP